MPPLQKKKKGNSMLRFCREKKKREGFARQVAQGLEKGKRTLSSTKKKNAGRRAPSRKKKKGQALL